MRILNLGSLNLDHVYDVDHFVAAGETISASRFSLFAGGKGLNQSIAAARAGAQVFHAGAVGEDGDSLCGLLRENGVDTKLIRTVPGPCGHAVIQNAHGQNCIIVHSGANHAVTEAQVDSALAAFGPGDLLLVQNETSCVPYALRRAKAQGLITAFNASPITPDLGTCPMDCVDYLFVNELEGQALCGASVCEDTALLQMLAQRYPAVAVLLTVGERGAYWAKGAKRLHHAAYRVPVADTTAAGDTFCGYYIAGSAAGMAPEDALEFACLASSLAVSRKGAASSIPCRKEVAALRGRGLFG